MAQHKNVNIQEDNDVERHHMLSEKKKEATKLYV